MKNLKYLALSALLIGGLYSCKKDAVRENDKEKPSTEIPEVPVDYSSYVSIGNSLTAGYADGGMYLDAQHKSFPTILAEKLGVANFVQPDVTPLGSGHLYFTGNPANPTGKAMPDAGWLAYGMAANPQDKLAALMALPKTPTKLNNIGVPGIRAVDMGLPGYGAANPYMGRMVPNAELSSKKYVDIVLDNISDATFFTFWLGNNDVLGYATSGGAFGEMGDPTSAAYRKDGLPELRVFDQNYSYLTDLLVQKRGIMSTIPPVSVAPFFTTVGPKIKAAAEATDAYKLDQPSADLLNKVYELAGYTSADGNPIFVQGQNYPVFKTGVAGKTEVRQLNLEHGGDVVLLTFGGETSKMQTQGLGFINKPEFPHEYDYVVALATLDVIKKATDGLAPLNVLVAGLKGLSTAGLGGFTLDDAVTNSGGHFTEEQANKIKAGLKQLGFTDNQIDTLTINQIIPIVDKAPAVVKPLLVMILMQSGMDQATAIATVDAMTLGDVNHTLDKAKAATAQKMVDAANACDPKLDPMKPEVSMVMASQKLANPIDTKWVLDVQENELVTTKTQELNDYIATKVKGNPNWILINSGDLLSSVDGKTIDGVTFGLQYVTGNMFSMDGIHLTPAGYAIVAKEMVKRMNAEWNQTLPDVNVKTYGGLVLKNGNRMFFSR
jgi:hypothetical protein